MEGFFWCRVCGICMKGMFMHLGRFKFIIMKFPLGISV